MSAIENLSATDFVVLDTETTGLDNHAEMVELSIIDKAGGTLFDRLIKPKSLIPAEAERIHGISNDDVRHAPAWPEVYDEVKAILSLDGRKVAIYNAEYDQRIIRQTCNLYGLAMIRFTSACVMLQYARF